ncbi:MAG: hydrogenase maturation nickel metallochaperone HypA [Armatimonadetes bacterium CG07_land_8_20_14_0_80_40_9]|nr:MAG: hydrogenase maturation nickel metallochaperone HypA [Armatimonadetes bacterium CG07_land_8_20_14_0_80_40_9]
MHEYTISSSIAKTVLTSAEENQAHKVVAINLEIGALVFLNPEQVEFWLKELFRETIAKEAKIRIKNIKPRIKCLDCNYEGAMKVDDNLLYHIMIPSFFCPQCSSRQIMVEKGRECLIKNIEIVK